MWKHCQIIGNVFWEAFGLYIKELRLLARAVFVLDENGKVVYTEYVSEATNHPDYDKAIEMPNHSLSKFNS